MSGSDVVTGVMGVLVNDAASTSFCALAACYWCLQLVGMVAHFTVLELPRTGLAVRE